MIVSFNLSKLPTVQKLERKAFLKNDIKTIHSSNNLELLVFYDGCGEIHINNKDYNIEKGSCLLVPPEQQYQVISLSRNACCYYAIHFQVNTPLCRMSHRDCVDQLRHHITEEASNISNVDLGVHDVDFRQLYLQYICTLGIYEERVMSLLERAFDEANLKYLSSNLMIGIYLSEVLLRLSRLTYKAVTETILKEERKNLPQKLQMALSYIHESYTKPLSLKDISGVANVSEQYVTRLFKVNLEITPVQYLNEHRLKQAKKLLAMTSLSVKEVSNKAGFENAYYFSRLFKKKTGQTPTEYRNRRVP